MDNELFKAQLNDLSKQLIEAFEILKADREDFVNLRNSGYLKPSDWTKCREAIKRIDDYLGMPIK